jgi:hypothetical protein
MSSRVVPILLETPARREADADRLEAPRVVVYQHTEVLLDQSTRHGDGMLALGHVARQFWVVGAKKGEFFVAPVVDLEPLGEV